MSLRLSGICRSYAVGGQRVQAVVDADLEVASGELVALMGPSGSGKSTLLSIAGLIQAPDRGTVELDGQPVAVADAEETTRIRRAGVGFVFQHFHLAPVLSALENVELALPDAASGERRARALAALADVGLAGCADRRPDRLSGGQRARVALARALVKRPSLLIADEPTAALDSVTAGEMVTLMKRLAKEADTAVIAATHDERLSGRCDRVLHMTDGRLSP